MSEFKIMTVLGGAVDTLGVVSGIGLPRLFEGSALYVYRLQRLLMRSDDFGMTFSNVGNGTTITAICQDALNTLIFSSNGFGVNKSYYHVIPDTTSGWTPTGALPSGFKPVDAETAPFDNNGILVGNYHLGTESRIVKSAELAPYSFADSDSGIPQTNPDIAIITDLEAV